MEINSLNGNNNIFIYLYVIFINFSHRWVTHFYIHMEEGDSILCHRAQHCKLAALSIAVPQ